MKRIDVDYEHNCETWWDGARENVAEGNPPPACIGLVETFGVDSIECSDEDAEKFIAWASGIFGWDEEPFVINPV